MWTAAALEAREDEANPDPQELARRPDLLFPTIRFALFFAVVLPLSWLLLPHHRRWRLFMLAASFVFYASWNDSYVLLLAASIAGNWVASLVIGSTRGRARRAALCVAVAANLGLLGWYKYAGFVADSTSTVAGWLGIDARLPVPNLLLPIGISFFTFQALSYVIDVYRHDVEPATLLDFAVYLSFFPHLVAGPIVRARELLPQIRAGRDPRRVDGTLAFWLIAAGLFKKVVIASYLSQTADSLFSFPYQHGGFEALVGVYAYALQIYADFSGYTDMAIGIALLLGFRFPANFDSPYSAVSLQDFWRRWHITLSRWLRDYLYVPLGGSRGDRRRTYRNVMLTMVLGGLWHGAAWTFVAWGALHGGGLVLERWRSERHAPAPQGAVSMWVRRIVTFHLVCLGWVFFRAPDLRTAFEVLGRILFATSSTPINGWVLAVIAGMLAVQVMPAGSAQRARAAMSRWSIHAQVAALAAVLVSVDVLGPTGVAPFIYFQF